MDQNNFGVPQVMVTVEDNNSVTTDSEGEFEFTPKNDLIPPFDVTINKKGFKSLKHIYDDDRRYIEITLSPVKDQPLEKETIVKLVDDSGNPLVNTVATINGKKYTSDKKGNILLKGKFNENSKVTVDQQKITEITFDAKSNLYKVAFEAPKQVAQETNTLPEIPITKEELKLSVFEQYKELFNKLSLELLAEKLRIEAMNAKIREELTVITARLRSEKNLTSTQRQQLNDQANRLEKQMQENMASYQNSAKRTGVLVTTLKNVILEKDSITIEAEKRIATANRNEQLSKKRSQRNLLIFSIITAAFIVFGIVFYLTYLKIRTQKRKLQAANKEINKIKNQLAKNVQELKESNEQLEVFVYKASHDIKGPLRSIIGLTTIGKEDVKDQVALNYFDHILLSTKKLDSLLLDLLQVTKVKQATVTYEHVNFKEMVDSAISSFEHLPGFEKIKIEVEIKDNGKFQSDKKILQSVIQNLIENPIKYHDPQKPVNTLSINIEADETGASLRFSDNGLGIPADMKDKVFEMFYKVNENSNGTGLGLYIVKTSVEKLNGKIDLESTEGIGTTFIVDFIS